MRPLLILATVTSAAIAVVDDGQGLRNPTGSVVNNWPTWAVFNIRKDQICNYPQPFVDGVSLATWQVHVEQRWPASSLCPGGAAKAARAFWTTATIPASGSVRITYRNSTSPCSSGGNEAACWALGLSQSAILNFGGGTWNAQAVFSAPGATNVTVSARTMVTDGKYCVTASGPAYTEIVAGVSTGTGPNCTPDQTRPYSFGFVSRNMMWLNATVDNSATTLNITDTSYIPATPFSAVFGDPFGEEEITVNSCTSTTCSVTRGAGGSTPSSHYPGAIWFKNTGYNLAASWSPYASQQNITLDTVAGISNVSLLWVGGELIRTCNVSGNVLQIGHESFPCTPNGYSKGRYWAGTGSIEATRTRMPVYLASTAQYATATHASQKGLQVAYTVKMWAGYTGGVAWEAKVHNDWSDRAMLNVYNVAWYNDNPATTVIANYVDDQTGQMAKGAGIFHQQESFWEFPSGDLVGSHSTYITDTHAWSGTRPAEIRRDWNMPQLHSTGLVPINPTIPLTTAGVAAFTTDTFLMGDGQQMPGWDASTKCAPPGLTWASNVNATQFDGQILRDVGQGGSNPMLGEITRNHATGLLMMKSQGAVAGSDRFLEAIFGHAACGGYWDWHNRSAMTTGTYCANAAGTSTLEPELKCKTTAFQTIAPFGRPLSIDAHPDVRVSGGWLQDDGTGAIKQVAPSSSGGYGIHQSWGVSHTVQFYFLPYLLKRSPFLGENVASLASAATFYATTGYINYDPGETYGHRSYAHHGAWGVVGTNSGIRGWPRSMTGIAIAVALLPDATPEKEYFSSLLVNNLAVAEGRFGIKDGYFYKPCPSNSNDCSKWWFGWTARANRRPPGTMMIQGPLYTDGAGGGCADVSKAGSCSQLFMGQYFGTAFNFMARLGLDQARPLYYKAAALPANLAGNVDALRSSGNRYPLGYYSIPDYQCPGAGPCTPPQYPALGEKYGYDTWLELLQDVGTNKSATYYAYPNLYTDRAWVAEAILSLGGKTPDGIDIRRARSILNADLYNPSAVVDLSTDANFQWTPDWEWRIQKLSIAPSTTSAVVSFTRPSQATTCSYALNPTSPSDASDTVFGVKKDFASFTVSGLTSATTYALRLTCKNGSEDLYDRVFQSFTTR